MYFQYKMNDDHSVCGLGGLFHPEDMDDWDDDDVPESDEEVLASLDDARAARLARGPYELTSVEYHGYSPYRFANFQDALRKLIKVELENLKTTSLIVATTNDYQEQSAKHLEKIGFKPIDFFGNGGSDLCLLYIETEKLLKWYEGK